jgi:alanyl-tRNA synthetase
MRDTGDIILNEHNKAEYAPAHSAEHILNGTMDKMFHCGRAFSSHVERKKSKLDYHLPTALTEEQIQDIENRVNDVVRRDVPVWMEFARKDELGDRYDLSRLPDNASETVRIVHIGDYDECLCVGQHVEHTAQIGRFRISSTRFQDGVQRIVFRLDEEE